MDAVPPAAVRRSAGAGLCLVAPVDAQTVRGWMKNGELKRHMFGTRVGYRIRLGVYEDVLSRATTGAISRLLLGGLPVIEGDPPSA
jgi:hypothetical protein